MKGELNCRAIFSTEQAAKKHTESGGISSYINCISGTTVKNERLEISTTNPNTADTGFYFKVLGGKGTSGNVYISNFRFYEKGGAGSGAPPIDPRPFRYSGAFYDLSSGVYTKGFVNSWQTSKQSIAKPGSGTVEETLVIGTVGHAVANTEILTAFKQCTYYFHLSVKCL